MQISAPGWHYLWFQWPSLGFYGRFISDWNRPIAGTRSRWISCLLALIGGPFLWWKAHISQFFWHMQYFVDCRHWLLTRGRWMSFIRVIHTWMNAGKAIHSWFANGCLIHKKKGCKYVLWRRVFVREKSVAVTKTTRGDWSNLQNMSSLEKIIFCLLIARI